MAKLIRDRSTPEQDAWWSAVQDAAKTAPKLTYERSAPMASEDVLERAERASRPDGYSMGPGAMRLVGDLAAEVRELRAKLDSEASHRLSLCADNERFVAENAELRKARERAKPEIEKAVELIQRWGCECEPQIGFTCGPCRVVEIIDAAMGGERNDGE